MPRASVMSIGLLFIPLPAWADTALLADPLGSEVVVTATREARALSDVPLSVSVITSEQVSDTPAKSLDDIVRRVPGVDLPLAASYQVHPTAISASMRGLGGIRALVLLDGVPLNDAFFGYVQWNRAPLETIERVEIVRGGGATLWGNYAMGGVINVLTAAPERNELALQGSGGSYGTYRGAAHGAWRGSDAASFGVDASVAHTDGFNQTPVAYRRAVTVPTSFTAHNAALSGDVQLNDGLTARMRINYHDNRQHLSTQRSTNTQRAWTYTGTLTQRWNERSNLTATVFHSDSRFQTDNTDTPDGVPLGAAEFVQNRHVTPVHDSGASLVWTRRIAGWLDSLALGADYHGISGTDVAHIYDDTNTEIRTDIGSGKQQFIGVFGQASIRPLNALELLLSGRYQRFRDYAGFDGSAGGLGVVPDQHFDSFDPRLSLRYALADGVALRAAAYRAFRAPTLDNLYRSFSTAFGIFYGNPALRPEKLKGGELGVDFTHANTRVQFTAFTNTIDNLLTSRNLDFSELPPGFFFGSRNINAGAARSRGVEAEADITLGNGFGTVLGYTYTDSTLTANELDSQSVGKQQAGIPYHKATAALTYETASRWRTALQLRWLSTTYGDNDHTLPVDSHLVVDLASRYPLSRQLEAFVEIENLLDRRYIADNSGFEAPRLGTPFSAALGIRVTLP